MSASLFDLGVSWSDNKPRPEEKANYKYNIRETVLSEIDELDVMWDEIIAAQVNVNGKIFSLKVDGDRDEFLKKLDKKFFPNHNHTITKYAKKDGHPYKREMHNYIGGEFWLANSRKYILWNWTGWRLIEIPEIPEELR